MFKDSVIVIALMMIAGTSGYFIGKNETQRSAEHLFLMAEIKKAYALSALIETKIAGAITDYKRPPIKSKGE